MTYAAVMVYLDAGTKPERRVRVAAGLADKFNAALIGISALAVRPVLVSDGMVYEDLMQSDVSELKATLAATGVWFRETASADHRKLDWRPVIDLPNDALADEARSADIVVVAQTRGAGDAYNTLDPGGAVLATGRPTLIVAEAGAALKADHVVLGWKDTREARRAVRDALPFLQQASRVTIVEICGAGEETAAQEHIDDVARYLTRHRINGGLRVIIHQEGSGAAQLIGLAQDEGADLIVTGAYGHSRLGEWIFGGMTRDLLANSPVCCLMSH
jgi:nucleotide-binding universal stress UspA family protein